LLLALVVAAGCQSKQGADVARSPDSVLIEEGFFTGADNNQLFYRKLGSGSPTVVYLHGGPSNMQDGGLDIEELAKGRTLIMFDMRSGGRSQLLGDRALLGFDRYVADLEAVRQHFRLKEMILVGQSFGAGLAARYALTHPGIVTRLMFWSPIWPAWEYFRPREQEVERFMGPEAAARDARIGALIASAPDSQVVSLCREDVRLYFPFYLSDPNALGGMKGDYCAGSPEAIRHQYLAGDVIYGSHASLGSWDIRPELPKLVMPLLVLEGAESRVPMEATKTWVLLAPNARFMLIPHSGHLLWLEGGARFFDVSGAFLNGRWPDGAEVIR
jgi:proline iminopeptidase